ncbi:hypothetical protein H5410_059748 [Solanum commersonii]|uniref:Uncharacterized protein n=1 Tax=Solanum commersonii TaxID=4109 RepID=A0A9J5W4E6_SOLCO|nr:hypothetical protein H5410_059748 [Solanum commersonii]
MGQSPIVICTTVLQSLSLRDRVGVVYVQLASCHLKLDHKDEVVRAYDIVADYYKMMKKLKGCVLPYCAIAQILYIEGTSYRNMSISCRGNIMLRESNTFISGHLKAKRDQRTLQGTTILSMTI